MLFGGDGDGGSGGKRTGIFKDATRSSRKRQRKSCRSRFGESLPSFESIREPAALVPAPTLGHTHHESIVEMKKMPRGVQWTFRV